MAVITAGNFTRRTMCTNTCKKTRKTTEFTNSPAYIYSAQMLIYHSKCRNSWTCALLELVTYPHKNLKRTHTIYTVPFRAVGIGMLTDIDKLSKCSSSCTSCPSLKQKLAFFWPMGEWMIESYSWQTEQCPAQRNAEATIGGTYGNGNQRLCTKLAL